MRVGVDLRLGVVGRVAAAFVGLRERRLVSGCAQGVALGIGGIDVCLQVANLLLAGGTVAVIGVDGAVVGTTEGRR